MKKKKIIKSLLLIIYYFDRLITKIITIWYKNILIITDIKKNTIQSFLLFLWMKYVNLKFKEKNNKKKLLLKD